MRYFVMPSDDIRDNLATEQYLMNEKDFLEPLVLFYIQKPCIIVGRNQNTIEEINSEYVKEHDITVTRRLSGGGAVYDDLGNVSFSFVVNADDERFGDFKKLTQPIVHALQKMGASSVEVSGRNDILVAGKKFSGNAMYTQNGKMFSHGTLAYDVDLDVLTHALNVPADKIASKGIKSVRSRVTNLRPHLDPQYQNLSTTEFCNQLILSLFSATDLQQIQAHEYHLTADDSAKIAEIKNNLYANWDWVYGKSPAFTVQKRRRFKMGTIDARLQVEQGKIVQIKFYGDFFGQKDVAQLEQTIVGTKYELSSLQECMANLDIDKYFSGITAPDLIDLLIS